MNSGLLVAKDEKTKKKKESSVIGLGKRERHHWAGEKRKEGN